MIYPVYKANSAYKQISNIGDKLDEIKKELKILEKVQKKKKWHRRIK